MTSKAHRYRLWLLPLLLAGLVVVVGTGQQLCEDGTCALPPGLLDFSGEEMASLAGSTTPAWSAVDLEGRAYSDAALEGKTVILNLWAKSCEPCLSEIPNLNALHEAHAGGEVVVLGLEVETETNEELRAVAESEDIRFPVARATPQTLGAFAQGSIMLPTTLVIGPDGIVREVLTGYQETSTLEAALVAAR